MPEPDPCELLRWDSEHFGLPIARLPAGRLDQELAVAADAFCKRHGVRCLYLFADDRDAETARVAAIHGYRQVDLRYSVRRPLAGEELPDPPTRGWTVREAEPRDAQRLAALARRSHGGSRFYFDGGFEEERVDALYEAWLRRGLDDERRVVLVVDVEGEAVGYQISGIEEDGSGRLELLAIDEAHRRHGAGLSLLAAVLRSLRARGADEAVTVIQARNVPSARVHQRVGFLTERVDAAYHRWYPPPG